MKPLPLASMPEIPTSTARSGATTPRFRTIASTTRLHGTVEELPFNSVIRLRVLCCDVILTKRERHRVHAVAQPSLGRSVIEDMSQMRATARPRNFPAKDRCDRIIFVHGFFANRLPKARPAGAGVELCVGPVEWIAAARTNIDSLAVIESVAIQ